MADPAPNESAGYLANQMARLFVLQLAEALRPLGLATAQFAVLMHLWQDKALTQKELSACIGVEQATMAKTLSRMERDGLIERRPLATDRRAQIIRPTQRARGLEQEAIDAADAVNRQLLSVLTLDEQQHFVGLLTRVIRQQVIWRAGQ